MMVCPAACLIADCVITYMTPSHTTPPHSPAPAPATLTLHPFHPSTPPFLYPPPPTLHPSTPVPSTHSLALPVHFPAQSFQTGKGVIHCGGPAKPQGE
jgi:hypothetical protein